MLPYRSEKEEDYRQRVAVLARSGVLAIPSHKQQTAGHFLNRALFDEVSFALFVSWLYLTIRNREKNTTRVNLVTLPDAEGRSLLAITRRSTSSATPGRGQQGLWLDNDYFACAVDANGIPVERSRQILCPVLNRIRLNLGEAGGPFVPPRSSADCCASRKRALWDYLKQGFEADLERTGALLGGQVVPLNLPSGLISALGTGLESSSQDLGRVFEETLLLYAVMASGQTLGLAHFDLQLPFLSNEIDFALYETAGHPKCSADNWRQLVSDQSLCVFEVTSGHRPDGEEGREVNASKKLDGSDHPKNKMINFMALSSLGFARLHYHYLSALPGTHLSSATQHALEQTPGFNYWCLGVLEPDLERHVLDEDVIDVARLRSWHQHFVLEVERAARAFASQLPGRAQRAPMAT
jgi:hypothetical protein